MTDVSPIEKTPEQIEAIEAEMRAQGVSTETGVPVDYFDFEEVNRTWLPDGVQWVEHRSLNEGERRKYLNKTNRELKVQRATGDAVMRMAPGDERKALLESAIVGWNLYRKGEPVAFNKAILQQWLETGPPKIIDLVEKDIRKANSWLQADMSVEDLDREIAALQELRDQKLKEEEGKDF